MNPPPPVTYSVDGAGVGWIIFNDTVARSNRFSRATQAALDAAITAAERDVARPCVIASGHEGIFVDGADLNELAALPDAATAADYSRAGQKLFQRLADFRQPIVCAIHGACVGGGFQMALACAWRLATTSPQTRVGLPETSLGMIPGWGGSVRLPRRVGAAAALDLILKAQLLGAAEAQQLGLVDEVVDASELRTRAAAKARELSAGGRLLSPVTEPAAPEYFLRLRESVRAKTRGHQPALLAAIEVVERGAPLAVTEALELEAEIFARVTTGEVCRNLIQVGSLREAARQRTLAGWFDDGASRPRPTAPAAADRRVAVVGGGVMGSGIVQRLAACGYDVVLRELTTAALERALEVVRGLFADAVRREQLSAAAAQAALQRVSTTTGWDAFETCDIVIEAIVENVAAKRALFSEIAAIVPAHAILASNTSALPIEEIAGHVPNPARTLGLHFFNPVSRMPLVELVLGATTSAATAARGLALVKALGKSPVVCRSAPGFLVTRVLFFYLNEAVRWWERGIATAAIDGALRDFGWPMGPLRLIDEVGVDVTEFIFAELAHYFPGRFQRSSATSALLASGLAGRKNGTGRGFYRYENREEKVNDAETRPLTSATPIEKIGDHERASASQLTGALMAVMSAEAERCLAEGVVASAEDIDFAFVSGAGFPAFRGGLLRWSRQGGNLEQF